ncbi:M20 family metallopeptidase [Bacillus sp. 03113]|uniref:M20 family metallopeptidase n=1 Tax=Bacillus sp. 03113 TaxID=2578211 RepID=UPI0011426DBC|nr:M20 family metallopeptidase [Bacillus sp. 03113]
MARKSTTLTELNAIMKRCSEISAVRYVSPTIHPGFKIVVAIDLHTSQGTKQFTITNNPDENFELTKAVNEYLDGLEAVK